MIRGRETSYLDSRISSNYGKEVLLSNWIERRYLPQETKSNSILPGLVTDQHCEKHRTVNQETYTTLPFIGDDLMRHREQSRLEAFRSFTKNSESQMRLPCSEDMLHNYTTSTTLAFDILPKLRLEHCMKAAAENKLDIKGRMPQFDTLRSYGNRTCTGIRARTLMALKPDIPSLLLTSYGLAYNQNAKNRTQTEIPYGPEYDGAIKYDFAC